MFSSGGSTAACTTTVGVLTPALTLVKTTGADTTTPGATVHYTVTVTNTGQTSYSAATFTDSLSGALDDATYNGDAGATTGVTSYTSPNLSWTGALSPGASATITYSVTVKSPDTGNKILTNAMTSTSAGSNCPTGGTDPRCTTTVAAAVLTITSATDVSTTVPTGVVRYTVTVTNNGQVAYTGANFALDLAGALDNATYNDDAAATSGAVSYAAPTLTWTGSLAPGATATITYAVTTTTPGTGDHVLTNTAVSSDVGSNCPSGSTDDACTATTPVTAQSIVLAELTSAFTLTGGANTTTTENGAVTMTVVTNSPTGYNVTVEAETPTLTAAGSGSSIPVTDLRVRETGTTSFQPLSDTDPVTTHTQSTPSALNGDPLSNDYQVDIPFVPSGRYTGTLDCIASTQ